MPLHPIVVLLSSGRKLERVTSIPATRCCPEPPMAANQIRAVPRENGALRLRRLTLRKAQRPMLVVVAAEAQRWASYTPPQIAPLIRFIREDCREATRIGRFIVFIPRTGTNPRL